MDNKRIDRILKILSQSEGYVKSSVLCEKLGITDRTLRTDLKESRKELLDNGLEINARYGLGYSLIIHDEEKYYAYLNEQLKEDSENQLLIPVYPDDRVDYLIRLFLSSGEWLKTEDLSEELFVSHSTLTNDLKQVREKLKYFHLEIESRPAYGMRVTGSEMHLRSAIAQYFYHTENTDLLMVEKSSRSEEQTLIANTLYKIISEERFHLTDIGFQNLTVHFMVAIMRMRQEISEEDTSSFEVLKTTREYALAERICQEIGRAFNIEFPDVEICYTAMHLAGKQAAQYHDVHLNYETLLEDTLVQIKDTYGMDFLLDIDLITALSLHLVPMMNRLQYDMLIQNPMIDTIKTDQHTAFEMGVILAQEIEKQYGFKTNDNEIGYIALHFALAIDRYKQKGTKKNIIIICASGLGSSQILLYKIRTKFRDQIGSIYTTQLYDLHNVDQSQYDFILSTVPIPFKTQIPAVHVQYFLDDEDISKVSGLFTKTADSKENPVTEYFSDALFFTDVEGKNRFDIIHQLCLRIAKVKEIPEALEQEIIRRE